MSATKVNAAAATVVAGPLSNEGELPCKPRGLLRHLRAEIDDQNLVVMQGDDVVERILRHL